MRKKLFYEKPKVKVIDAETEQSVLTGSVFVIDDEYAGDDIGGLSRTDNEFRWSLWED